LDMNGEAADCELEVCRRAYVAVSSRDAVGTLPWSEMRVQRISLVLQMGDNGAVPGDYMRGIIEDGEVAWRRLAVTRGAAVVRSNKDHSD